MQKPKLLFYLLLIFLFSCSKNTDQIETEELLPCGVPVSLSSDSVSEYAYFCDETHSETMVVYTPEDWEPEGDFPCIIFFHGGLQNDGQYTRQCLHFAERGIVAISANHRFTLIESYHKLGLKDSHSAIRWVKENRLSLGVDSGKIAVSGSSAGGTTALSCYLLHDYNHSSDDLLISMNPDVFALINPHLIEIFSLPDNTSEHPPTIILQGDSDDLTPLSELQAYRDEALSGGAQEIKIIVYPDRGHGFFNYRNSPEDYFNTLMRIDSFLFDHGYLPDYFDQK